MKICVNGVEEVVAEGISLQKLLQQKDVNVAVTVVELNERILKQTQWESTILHDKDSLEVVSFVGGG